MKTYGPYKGKDGRERIVLYDGKKTTTRSYPRVLVDAPDGTEVHHKDEDVGNNSLNNLEALTLDEHKAIHTKGPIYVDVICENCKNSFPKLKSKVDFNLKVGQVNTCGRSCAATLGGKASGESRRA